MRPGRGVHPRVLHRVHIPVPVESAKAAIVTAWRSTTTRARASPASGVCRSCRPIATAFMTREFLPRLEYDLHPDVRIAEGQLVLADLDELAVVAKVEGVHGLAGLLLL